jgi:hypothetical protein
MARFKDFGSGSNSTPAEPITFKIHDGGKTHRHCWMASGGVF